MLAVIAILMIPSMVRISGASAWSAVASGQAMGAISATVIGYGWGLTGPALVASTASPGRRRLFIESLRVKLTVIIPAVLTASVIAYGINTEFGSYAVAGCIAASLIGLSSEWFFVGLNRPWSVLVLETIPRVLGGVAGIILMDLGVVDARGALVCQSVGLSLGILVAYLWVLRHIAPLSASTKGSKEPLRRLLTKHRHGVLSQVMATGYMAAPISIVAWIAPSVLPTFAVLDKAQKQIVTVIQPAVTALQGFTPSAKRRQLGANCVTAAVLGAFLAVALFFTLLVIGAKFLTWLSAGQIPFESIHVFLLSLNCSVALLDSFLGRGILPALDRVDAVVRATSVCSVLGIASVFLLTPGFGATGALVGFGLGIGSRCVWETVVVVDEVREIYKTAPSDSPAAIDETTFTAVRNLGE